MQFMDDSFKGPMAVNVLETIAFQPVNGPRRKITQSGVGGADGPLGPDSQG